MNFSEFKKRPFFIPVLWALFLHLLFAAVAALIVLPAAETDKLREEVLNFKVRSVDTHSVIQSFKRGDDSPVKNPDRTQSFKSISVQSFLKKEPRVPPANPPDALRKKTDLDETLRDPGRNLDALVVQTEENSLKEKIPLKPKSTENSGFAARMAGKHRADAIQFSRSLNKPFQGLFSGHSQNVNIDPEEGMPGFTPSQGSMGNSDIDQGPAESAGELLKYESLDEFLDIQVSTYQDPAGAQNYYLIKIFAKKDAKTLKAMPKEILFTIDCSLSIHPERLEEFKKGITYCLAHFNPDDVFNIVSFKDKVSFFSPQSAPATPENIKTAEKFVAELTASDQTNVYLAFQKIVDIPAGRNPSNVILLSDGRPTHGVIDSRELINSVTRANRNNRPIFAFSGGARVNRYLLDFIAYQNRAWSQFIKKTWDIRKGLAEFYDKIRDPIFLNLRYRLNGLDEGEVFPKSLPDFYRNAEFTLYGKFDEEDQFSMQLLGDVDGKTKELIFSRSLKQAPHGGPEIMKGYAFNKIYYLISQVTAQGRQPQLLKQISDLSKRYGIATPYSPDLESRD